MRSSCKSLLGKRYQEVLPCSSQGSGLQAGGRGPAAETGRGKVCTATTGVSPGGCPHQAGTGPSHDVFGGAPTASGRKGELLKVSITRRPKPGCDTGRVLPWCSAYSGSTQPCEAVFKGSPPSPLRSARPLFAAGGKSCSGGPWGWGDPELGWALPPKPPGLSLPTPLPSDFPSSTHQAGLRPFPDVYLILLLKLWHYLQWQWYRPAQDPLKQICLQVKSKKYFDS